MNLKRTQSSPEGSPMCLTHISLLNQEKHLPMMGDHIHWSSADPLRCPTCHSTVQSQGSIRMTGCSENLSHYLTLNVGRVSCGSQTTKKPSELCSLVDGVLMILGATAQTKAREKATHLTPQLKSNLLHGNVQTNAESSPDGSSAWHLGGIQYIQDKCESEGPGIWEESSYLSVKGSEFYLLPLVCLCVG